MVKIRTFGSSSAGNSYLLSEEGSALLLEAGIQPKKMTLNWSEVEGLLITHEHNDHAKYAKDYIRRGAFNIYCTPGTAKQIKGVENYRVNTCSYLEPFKINDWQIIPFKTEHDVVEPAGFLIRSPKNKKILFATDTYYIRYKFPGVTHFLIECNFSIDILNRNRNKEIIDAHQYKRILKSHFELNNLIKFFEANDLSKAEQIHLIHLSDRNSNEEYFINKVQSATGIPTYIADKSD